MIFSANHQLIFVKPQKCASTSIEMFLESAIWPDRSVSHSTACTIMPCGGVIGYRGDKRLINPRFYNHMSLSDIKKKLGAEYEDATKISVIRDPVEKAVSLYFHVYKSRNGRSESAITQAARRLRGARPMPNFFSQNHEENIMEWLGRGGGVDDRDKFFERDKSDIAIDYFIRFPHLDDDLCEVCKRFDLNPKMQLPHVKKYSNLTASITAEIYKDANMIMCKAMQMEMEIYSNEMHR